MKEKKGESLLNEKLQDYEAKIIEYYVERANFSGQSNTLATIIGFLSIYGSLTQNQLKFLTGFSKSTISTGLANLINVNYVKKEKLTGKREYEYILYFDSQDSIDDALGSVKLEIDFFTLKIKELEKRYTKKNKGYDLLLERMREALEVFELYQETLKYIKIPDLKSKIENKSSNEKFLTVKDLQYILENLDPEIKRIENTIVDFFKFESAYSTLKEFVLIVFVYFILRKVLTQNKIRELTGLSVGKISQVVNHLITKGHIIQINKEEYKDLIPDQLERQNIYAMISIKNSFFQSGINSLREMIKWDKKFSAIEEELDINRDKLEKLYGYDLIKSKVSDFVEVMQIYKKALDIFSKLL